MTGRSREMNNGMVGVVAREKPNSCVGVGVEVREGVNVGLGGVEWLG